MAFGTRSGTALAAAAVVFALAAPVLAHAISPPRVGTFNSVANHRLPRDDEQFARFDVERSRRGNGLVVGDTVFQANAACADGSAQTVGIELRPFGGRPVARISRAGRFSARPAAKDVITLSPESGRGVTGSVLVSGHFISPRRAQVTFQVTGIATTAHPGGCSSPKVTVTTRFVADL